MPSRKRIPICPFANATFAVDCDLWVLPICAFLVKMDSCSFSYFGITPFTVVEVFLKVEPEFRRISKVASQTLGYGFIDPAAFFYDVDDSGFAYARNFGKFSGTDMPPYQ